MKKKIIIGIIAGVLGAVVLFFVVREIALRVEFSQYDVGYTGMCTEMTHYSFEELMQKADNIYEAQVLGIDFVMDDGPGPSKMIYSIFKLKVTENYKGEGGGIRYAKMLGGVRDYELKEQGYLVFKYLKQIGRTDMILRNNCVYVDSYDIDPIEIGEKYIFVTGIGRGSTEGYDRMLDFDEFIYSSNNGDYQRIKDYFK